MKTKLLILPLALLFFLPTDLMAAYKNRRAQKTVGGLLKLLSVSPPFFFYFRLYRQDVGNYLQIV